MKEEEEEEEEEGDEEEMKEEEEEEEKENEEGINECKELKKCELCNENSLSSNLCLKCNNKEGYYLVNNMNSKIINDKYIDCANNKTKPSNFYYNEENEDYRPCYETCSSCTFGGNEKEHNCTSCENIYFKNPDLVGSTNCLIKCDYFYYYKYNQYKCTKDNIFTECFDLLIIKK